jgi:hypothetical protein
MSRSWLAQFRLHKYSKHSTTYHSQHASALINKTRRASAQGFIRSHQKHTQKHRTTKRLRESLINSIQNASFEASSALTHKTAQPEPARASARALARGLSVRWLLLCLVLSSCCPALTTLLCLGALLSMYASSSHYTLPFLTEDIGKMWYKIWDVTIGRGQDIQTTQSSRAA